MFIGPFEGTVPWSTNGLVGTYRFVEKFWRAKSFVTNESTSQSLLATVHKTIQKVSQDIESFKFNTAVSTLMIAVNEIEKEKHINIEDYKKLLQVLAPFAPHVAEELWISLGETTSIHLSSWPTYDETLAVDDSITIGVQVNGKVRGEITVAPDASKEDIEACALALPRIQELLGGKSPAKVIVVPGKIVSIVV
jgi:leucyl-tRNA synthetase